MNIGRMEVSNGIRQGCTGSPQLFVMIVNMIIQEIITSTLGYRDEKFYIPALFFADDGLLLTNSVKQAKHLLEVMKGATMRCGLEMNTLKSQCIMFNYKGPTVTQLQGMEVVERIKYLGVVVCNKRDCFQQHKKEKIRQARKMVNLTYSVIARSCNKLLIGKTYWKNIVLPGVLYASSVITWTNKENDELQRIDNQVWRQILGGPRYTPVVALQGEIGTSSVRSRDMKNKLRLAAHLLTSRGGLLSGVVEEMMEERSSAWAKQILQYMREVGITDAELRNLKKEKIKLKVNEWEERRWREGVEEKETLRIYRSKNQIGEENIYTNSFGSMIMFRCRTNTLRLNWRNRFQGGQVECELCEHGREETLSHFIRECAGLKQVREVGSGGRRHGGEDTVV